MAEHASWRIRTGLGELLRDEQGGALISRGAQLRGDALEVVLSPGTTVQSLEQAVRAAAGRRGAGLWMMRLLRWGAGMAIGAAIVLGLTVFDLFAGLAGEAVDALTRPSPWRAFLLAATFVVATLIVAVAPQVISGDDGRLATAVRQWLDRDDQAVSRIRRRLRSSIRSRGVRRVVVWNAMQPQALAVPTLVACIPAERVQVELRVHGDQVDSLRHRLAVCGVEAVATEGGGPESTAPGPITLDVVDALRSIFGGEAARALLAALTFATVRAQPRWRAALDASGALPHDLVSGLIVATIVDADGLPADGTDRAVPGGRAWLDRFATDYALVEPSVLDDGFELTSRVDWSRTLQAHHDAITDVQLRHRSPLVAGVLAGEDPTAALCLLTVLPQADWALPAYQHLLNQYVAAAVAREHYRGGKVLAEALAQEQRAPVAQRRLLSLLSIESLGRLVQMFLVTGNAAQALWIAEWTRRFTGPDGTIQIALTHEAVGEYDAALANLNRLAGRMEQLQQQLITAGPATLGANELGLLARYSAACAWVMLSSGFDRLDANQRLARRHLELLDDLTGRGLYVPGPTEARQAENLWALLLELEGDLAGSVARHAAAADMPGVPLRRVLGSLINLGRSQRELAVARWDGRDAAVLTALSEAAANIEQGYREKVRIGDTDEAPIGAHNLALTELYRFAVTRAIAGDARSHAEAALRHAEEGLAIIDATGSSRKRTMLARERAIAEALLAGALAEPPVAELAGAGTAVDVSESDAANLATLDRLLRNASGPASQPD